MILSSNSKDKEYDVTINKLCKVCGKHHKVHVKFEDLINYIHGETTNNTFPYLHAKDKLLLSTDECGMCYDKRHPNLFESGLC